MNPGNKRIHSTAILLHSNSSVGFPHQSMTTHPTPRLPASTTLSYRNTNCGNRSAFAYPARDSARPRSMMVCRNHMSLSAMHHSITYYQMRHTHRDIVRHIDQDKQRRSRLIIKISRWLMERPKSTPWPFVVHSKDHKQLVSDVKPLRVYTVCSYLQISKGLKGWPSSWPAECLKIWMTQRNQVTFPTYIP